GHDFEVRIVGAVSDSILQGTLLIDEQQFEARFPTQGGHRRFLFDAPSERIADVSADLTRSLRDLGLALEPSARRLDSFHAVQNTYLTIFQGLGGLGLLLGSIGLGMVLLRNTLERRAELALMAALGFAPTRVRWLVFSEYGFLLMLGLGAGAIAALVAILPAMRAPGSDLSLLSFWILCVAVGLNGAFWLLLATRVAVQRVPLDALRAE
ncbi:MAG: putative ABC transport system permease protein, partial [Candidatus Paceibacteria bacterium]